MTRLVSVCVCVCECGRLNIMNGLCPCVISKQADLASGCLATSACADVYCAEKSTGLYVSTNILTYDSYGLCLVSDEGCRKPAASHTSSCKTNSFVFFSFVSNNF